MAVIKCSCGNSYDSKFKFCPECAAPNPSFKQMKKKLKEVSEDEPIKTSKKKFTKVGESNLSDKQVEDPGFQVLKKEDVDRKKKHSSATVFEEYEDIEINDSDDDEDDDLYDQDSNDYEDEDVDDSSDEDEDYSDEEDNEDYEDEDDYEDDEDVDDEDDEEEIVPVKFKSNAKVLAAPSAKPVSKISKISEVPSVKTKNLKNAKSSLSKAKKDYDPNFDGYYDDRLPALLDEVTKASHFDVFLKIGLSVVCIAALITYCIFYVQV